MTLISGTKSLRLILAVYQPDVDTSRKTIPVRINIERYDPIQVGLRAALIDTLSRQITSRVNTYFDTERYLKTLLNFGNDTQRIITNWKLDPNDSTKLLVKLLTPLDFDFDVGDNVFINREVANTIVDTIKLELLPQSDASLWLRPKNTEPKSFITDTELLNIYSRRLTNKTLAKIGIDVTGSEDQYGGYSFKDNILRKWYTDDYKSTELNIDYSNYENFVTYGSAKLRLDTFKQKITKISELETRSKIYVTGSLSSGSIFGIFENAINTPTVASLPLASSYILEGTKTAALEIENIIRSFDGYERYLFYESGSAYSASVYWQPNGTEYNTDGTWPKLDQAGHLYHPTSSTFINWYDIQSGIAQRYDDQNVNLLSNAIPTYLLDDLNSVEFIKFTQLIGHFFDNLKVYIDHMPYMYDRKVNATDGLSQDLVWNVAKSFGLSLTNPESAVSLYNFVADSSVRQRREQVSELWKRFLHNVPYLNRISGTRDALKALLNIFGLNEQIVGIRETDSTTTGSFEIFNEVTNALNFNTGSYLILPMSGSSQRQTDTLQFRFNNPLKAVTTLGVGVTPNPTGSWVINLATHPSASSTYGRLELKNSTGQILLSSSYTDMFGDDYYDVMVRNDGPTITLNVVHADGEEIMYSSSMSTNNTQLRNSWTVTQDFYLGGSGSLSTNNFNGFVDEIRVWGEKVTDSIFYNQALNPGSFVGNDYTSPVERLWVRLSFHTPRNMWSGSILNESPYRNKDGGSDPALPLLPNITNIIAVGFESKTTYPFSMNRVTRKVKQFTTNNGAYSYASNKIIIAPPPVFNEVGQGNEKILHRTKSIVSNDSRRQQQQSRKYIGLFVSPTDAVNNLLIRSLGNLDIKSLVGINPRYQSRYVQIEQLQNYYKQHYVTSVNIPQFVRFFDQLAPSLFDQASQVIPGKATLSTGIVIEPNILERKKVMFERPVKLSGAGSRRNSRFASTEKTYQRDFDITLSDETTISLRQKELQTGYYNNYNTTIEFNELTTLQGTANNSFESTIRMVNTSASGDTFTYTTTLPVTSSMPSAEIEVGLLDGAKLEATDTALVGAYNYYEGTDSEVYSNVVESTYQVFDSDVDKLSYIKYLQTFTGMSLSDARSAAISYKPGNIIDVGSLFGQNENLEHASVINIIAPRANLEDYGVINYFIKESGIYYFETVRKEIIGERQLNFLTGTDATWSFGKQYNKNDVVVQYGASGKGKTSNGKLFRYIAQDAPSVSYNPPYEDKNRWAPVFYRGKAVQTPYRIIFDINKASGDEAVFTLPVTQVSIGRPTVQPNRFTTRLSFRSFTSNARETGIIRLQSIASLFSVNVGVQNTPTPNIRVRLYDTAESRDADLDRVFGVEPTGNHGVLLDMKFESDSTNKNIGLYPPVTLINNDAGATQSSVIYYTIEELNGVTYPSGFIVAFRYFGIEAPIELPIGYLPRHYKFYRDTLLSTKRRNYAGCVQTQATTIDGRSPVEVNLTAGTSITVTPNVLQEEENFGGINLNIN